MGELMNTKFVLMLHTTLFAIFLILRRVKRDTTNTHRTSSKVPVILVRFESNLNFLEIFWKNHQMSNFKRIRPVGESFLADRRTGRQEEANSSFSHFF